MAKKNIPLTWHSIKNPDGWDLPPPNVRLECANVNGFRYFAKRTRPAVLTRLLDNREFPLDDLITKKILAFWRYPQDDSIALPAKAN